MNRTLRVVHNGDFSDAFIIRINGTVGEKVSSRDELYQVFSVWMIAYANLLLAVADLGGRTRRAPPTAQNFLNFMQFFTKFGKIICWRPTLEG